MSGMVTREQLRNLDGWEDFKDLPDDHPIYSEGPTIAMVSRMPKRMKMKSDVPVEDDAEEVSTRPEGSGRADK